MRRKITPEQAELRAKLAELKALNAAHREAEAPLRLARAKLAQSLNGYLSRVQRHADKVAKTIYKSASNFNLYGWHVECAEADLRTAEAEFNTALVNLQTFDELHRVEGACYPSLPAIDREAIARKGTADLDASMHAFKTGRRCPQP